MIQTPVVLWGASGQMGCSLKSLIEKPQSPHKNPWSLSGCITSKSTESEVEQALSTGQIVLDFSTVEGCRYLLQHLMSSALPCLPAVLIGTTGLSDEIIEEAQRVSEQRSLRMLWAPNTSLGIAVIYNTLTRWMGALGDKGFDIELVEYHHNKKRDVPSGTAKLLLQPVLQHPQHKQALLRGHTTATLRQSSSVGVHGVRGGGIFGRHELHFISEDEHLTLTHAALSRSLFARGALLLAGALLKREPGFYRYEQLQWSDFENPA